MLVGGIIAVLGLLAILFPYVTGVSLSLLLGILAIVGGVVHVASAFSAQGWKGFLWQVFLGVVYAGAGIILMANPVLTLASVTILLTAYFLVEGVVEIFMGFRLRPESNWGWVIASGVVSLLLAGLIWVNWPSSAAWAVGLLFGVGLLTNGVSMILVAMGGRNAAQQTVTPPTSETGGV